MAGELHIPGVQTRIEESDVCRWYDNIPIELAAGFLSPAERACMEDYYRVAGLLRPRRRRFFRRHYGRTFARAAAFLMAGRPASPLLDLGCGCGTQSLYLALHGARVLALDADGPALDVLRKRMAFYRANTDERMDLTPRQADAFALDYAGFAPLGGMHSMFAFNMMQPSGRLLDKMLPHMAPGARLAVLDGNRSSWIMRLLPWRRRPVWSPHEFRAELTARQFEIVAHEGGTALPPPAWNVLPDGCARRLDAMLSHTWLFPVSHLMLAQRVREPDDGVST